MDFSTIKNNINNFKYDDYTSIIEDTRLVFDNCREYNEPDSEIYEVCERLSSYFEKEAKKAGLLDTKQLAMAKKWKLKNWIECVQIEFLILTFDAHVCAFPFSLLVKM